MHAAVMAIPAWRPKLREGVLTELEDLVVVAALKQLGGQSRIMANSMDPAEFGMRKEIFSAASATFRGQAVHGVQRGDGQF